MGVQIVIAKIEDVKEIAQLSYQVGRMHDGAMPEYFKSTPEDEHVRIISAMLKSETDVVFKAVCDRRICGFLCLYVPERERTGFVYAKTGIILNMGVDVAYRRQGIGTALIHAAEKHLEENGIYAFELGVYEFNDKAYKLYEKLGFATIERQMFKRLS